jgi:hypothetical protein
VVAWIVVYAVFVFAVPTAGSDTPAEVVRIEAPPIVTRLVGLALLYTGPLGVTTSETVLETTADWHWTDTREPVGM